ncbi:helix-turn-helix transcriptional regulator [Conexibacter woesei]|uniref:Transcriptional regulator, LuxR family n=1 Tax=Conexibacter woesei (strain DSM 14684 / CCUG 47730 / CIP 108061 / JCM 11494 / NBRC 100937 / ID131577) TaxID=469383 RepID=D3EYY8_CONWI|nr:LuxR family transcriptional regulator [Conexibacter woesei]ADB49862.1 transcriptional regulator, LuxR family [Conexibacter woesei DSM 14684]
MDAESLLEREHELETLAGALDAALTGAGSLLLVEAPAGIGKSALLRAARRLARDRGIAQLVARGTPLERALPFGVAGRLLERSGERAPREPLAVPDDDGLGLIRTFAEAIVDLAWPAPASAAARPLLVVVDDAQWADAPSLRVLVHLAARLDDLPVALVAGVRTGEPDAPSELLEALRGAGAARTLRPAPLGDAAIAQLVTRTLGEHASPELVRACANASGGNPFYLRELLAAVGSEAPRTPTADQLEQLVPDSVLRSVLVRLARLGQAASRLASAAAVLGDGATLDAAATLAELEPLAAEQAADVLADAGVLDAGEPLRFSHPLIASALLADMGSFARARAHRRAAELVADAGPERVAMHLLHARPQRDPAVVTPLRRAAALARERGAPAESVRLLERALAEPPPAEQRPALLLELADAGIRSGAADAPERIEEALELIDEPHARGAAQLALSRQLHHVGEFARAAALAGDARAALPPGDPLQPRLLAAHVASAFLDPGLHVQSKAMMEPLLAAARRGDLPHDPGLLALLAMRMAEAGEPVATVRTLADAALAGGPLLDHDSHGTSLGFLAAALLWSDELELAERWLAQAVAAARRHAAVLPQFVACYFRACVHLQRGRLAEAVADAEHALEIHRYGWASSSAAATVLARAQLERGDLDAAREAIAVAETGDERRPEHVLLLEARARVRLAAGDHAGALADALAAGRHTERYGAAPSARAHEWRPIGARAAHALGDTRAARELVDEALALTRDDDAARIRGDVLRAAGVVTGGEEGLALLAEAVTLLERSPALLSRAHALAEHGAALRRAGQRRAAREPLQRALELADDAGAEPLVARVRDELRALGLRPRRAARSGAASLTPAERRIAELAADGLSTPQIAHHLTITKKTVETHLSHIFGKLDVRSRTELPAALTAGEQAAADVDARGDADARPDAAPAAP